MVTNWQPIETAPNHEDERTRYGPTILVWDGNCVSPAKRDKQGYFCDLESVDRDGEWNDFFPQPTHWMPLPLPPKNAK
jgi:hypothetical protein